MHPLLNALGSNPALVSAVRAGARELRPAVERALSYRRPRVAGVGPYAATFVVLASFSAGVVAGWLTAPRSGALMRASLKDGLESWFSWAVRTARRGQHDVADAPDGPEPTDAPRGTTPDENGNVEVTAPH